jgi:hypothetical protein
MKSVKSFALLAISVLLLAGLLTAQQTTAKIFGVVQLEDGSLVPGVNVEATSPKLVGKTTAVTDENGVFRLVNLSPGTYKVVFSLQGFQTIVQENIKLSVEQTLNLKINMKLGNIEEAITITGQAQIDVKSTSKGMTLTKEVFQSLPKGRNFDSLIAAIPGVVQEDDLLGGTSIDGASGDENMYYVDGVNTNNLVNGLSGQKVNLDFVDEVQIKSSGYQAEFGGSLGGVINVISRSGGNEFHGEAIGYMSSSKLQTKERDILDEAQLDTTGAHPVYYYPFNKYVGQDTWNRYEGGFNLGGPILKNKLWFFGSFMPGYFTRDRILDYELQGSDLKRTINRKETQYNGIFKLTSQIAKNLRATAGFVNASRKYLGDNDTNRLLPYSYSASKTSKYDAGWTIPNMTVNGTIDWNASNSLMMSVRGGWFKTDQINSALPIGDTTPRYRFSVEQPYGYIPSTNSMFPEISANLVHAGGWTNKTAAENAGIQSMLRERINVNYDATYFAQLAGEHSFKAGFQFIRQGQNVSNNSATGPYVLFAWDMDLEMSGVNYGRGKYGWYAVRGNDKSGPYGEVYDVYANSYALYLQDSWTIGSKLTLNLGVRTENEYLPGYSINPDDPKKAIDFPWSKKIAPRLGFIYDVNGDSSFKVFGSFGIFQDMMKLDMAANAFGGLKWKSAFYKLEDWDFTKIGVNGNYPGEFIRTYDFRPTSFDTVDPDMKPFTQREISLGLEKKLSEDITGSVRLVSKSVLYAIEDNAIYQTTADGWTEVYYQTNPGSQFLKDIYAEALAAGDLNPNTPDPVKAKREYLALNLSVEKRFSDNWMGGASYTLSRLSGNYSGLYSSDEIRNSPNGERAFDLWYLGYDKSLKPIDGALPSDRPHVFKVYGSYAFPFGLTVGGIFNAMSGTPITEDWILDAAGYFPFNRGNMGRTPFLTYANIYAEYNLKLGKNTLQLSVNVDNVYDTKTARGIYAARYVDSVSPSTTDETDTLYLQRRLIANDWKPNPDPSLLDPLYGKEKDFFAPLAIRFGVRFIF